MGLLLRKSWPIEMINPTKHTMPTNHIATNELRITLRLVLMLANRRMIQVMMPMMGIAMKKINVPQANTFCHPALSKKSFAGNSPTETIPKANKPITSAIAIDPMMK